MQLRSLTSRQALLARIKQRARHMENTQNKRVAILVSDGFEQVEFTKPKKALDDAGVKTVVVSLKSGEIRGFNHADPADSFPVDKAIEDVSESEFDALLIPGGIINPDNLRGDETVLRFTRAFFEKGKPVFAICHGPQVLISAEVVKGRRLTSYHTVRKDLENAGAEWVDESVVVDQGLVTSRNPDDIPDFIEKVLEELAEGVHSGQHA